MLVSPLSLFLDSYSQSTSSVEYKALCMVISFLVLWFICLSSSLVHFKNGPEYLTGVGTAQVFIPFIRFLLFSLVSSSFLDHQWHSFLTFSFISTCLMVSAFNISQYLYVFFFPSVLVCLFFCFFVFFFSWLGRSITSIMCRFPLFIICVAYFSMRNSIPMSWLHILTTCIRVSNSFSFFTKSLMSSMYMRWLIFSCYLLSLYPSMHFLSMWLRSIIVITNSNGGRASTWNIPLWIFASTKILLTVNSTLQVSMVFSINFMTSSDILYILRQFIIQLFRTISYVFLYYYYYLLIRIFYISDIWWFFTGVWVTASLLKSPGLFSVFWPFSIM